jgi:hypothetical protein
VVLSAVNALRVERAVNVRASGFDPAFRVAFVH